MLVPLQILLAKGGNSPLELVIFSASYCRRMRRVVCVNVIDKNQVVADYGARMWTKLKIDVQRRSTFMDVNGKCRSMMSNVDQRSSMLMSNVDQ